MYYDGNTGRYLEYDEETKTYKYHSATVSEGSTAFNYFKAKPSQKKFKKKWDKHKVLIISCSRIYV